tara:strand:- start:153 stop:299 length:147 start_codon:yes stop_codon:yes gene_type:complete
MNNKIFWLKYLSPLIGILLSPVTILFLWTFWSGPVIYFENEIAEEVEP